MPLSIHRRLATVAVATVVGVATTLSVLAPPASAAHRRIGPRAFAMHYLDFSHPYPVMPFRSARIQDMGVSWADLQPRKHRWDAAALHRLDSIVHTFKHHHAQPLIVLGQTPRWARVRCRTHGFPATTCGPRYTGLHSAWAKYVRVLSHRYRGVYFEAWNEPNLHNGWNSSIRRLARMQATAYTVIHHAGTHDRLVSPSVAVTAGHPFRWLRHFFHKRGGRRFDVFGIHLYPSDYAARHWHGPEWSYRVVGRVHHLLRHNGVYKLMWNTEANVGRYQYSHVGGCHYPHCTSRTFSGWSGAAMVARTYVLELTRGVRRIFWYAADDRGWGGTWMEQRDFRTLTDAGLAEVTLYRLLRGARPHGCSVWHGHWTCRFHLRTGRNMLVKWSTSGTYHYRAPRHTKGLYNAIGRHSYIHRGKRLRITFIPKYILGTFRV